MKIRVARCFLTWHRKGKVLWVNSSSAGLVAILEETYEVASSFYERSHISSDYGYSYALHVKP